MKCDLCNKEKEILIKIIRFENGIQKEGGIYGDSELILCEDCIFAMMEHNLENTIPPNSVSEFHDFIAQFIGKTLFP